jgi:hypothetical protein
MTSSKALYDYFEQKGELIPSIVFDLFGYENWTTHMKDKQSETLSMFLGLFKGLYLMEVSYKEIYRCYLKNKLDDLIHIKYSINKSMHYIRFCEKQIKIGYTFISENNGKNNGENEDDNKINDEPFIYSQIQPQYHYNQSITQIMENSLGDEDEIILHKINAYKRQDKSKGRNITSDYVTINDVKQLLFKQEKKCYVCGDNVITKEWQPNCLYQFTLDRIDNKLPHNKNNVLICCEYCNCFGWQNVNTDICLYKLCQNKCHEIKRNNTRTRDNVSKTEITKLLIK